MGKGASTENQPCILATLQRPNPSQARLSGSGFCQALCVVVLSKHAWNMQKINNVHSAQGAAMLGSWDAARKGNGTCKGLMHWSCCQTKGSKSTGGQLRQKSSSAISPNHRARTGVRTPIDSTRGGGGR